MFIPVENKEELLQELSKHLDDTVVLHYYCSECSDDQVTYDHEPQDIIDEFEKNNMIMAAYDCTSCGHCERYISADMIYGIETLD